MSDIVIRQANAGDAYRVVPLMDDFGHSATEVDIKASIERLADDDRYLTIVAESGAGLIGYARFHLLNVLHTPQPWMQVIILVTAVPHRRRGVASAMLREGEEWARRRDATVAMLMSGMSRNETHEFYERRGWEKTGFRFVKSIAGD